MGIGVRSADGPVGKTRLDGPRDSTLARDILPMVHRSKTGCPQRELGESPVPNKINGLRIATILPS